MLIHHRITHLRERLWTAVVRLSPIISYRLITRDAQSGGTVVGRTIAGHRRYQGHCDYTKLFIVKLDRRATLLRRERRRRTPLPFGAMLVYPGQG